MKARTTHRIALALLLLFVAAWLCAAPAQHEKQVVFLPQVAAEKPDGRVALRIEAWVNQPKPRRLLHWALARYLRIDEEAMDETGRELFRERTQLFRVDSKRRQEVGIMLPDGQKMRLPRTGADGRSGLVVTMQPNDASPWIRFTGTLAEDSAQRFEGRALRVPSQGWSVVTDIDDTIKHSQVLDRRELLLNTFTRPFRAVLGMAQCYSDFALRDDATRFHYVSTSPLQLHPALAGFLVESGFPEGSIHLREATRWRTLVADDETSVQHKREAIENLLATFPQRRFILIGDSGENDPAIYADIARRHPGRIALIAIRRIGNSHDAASGDLQRDTGETRWQWFDDASELILPSEEAG